MFGTLIRWAQVQIPNLTFDQADEGAQKAIEYAPFISGALARAIKPMPGRTSNTAYVVSGVPKGQKDPRGNVPYQYWISIGKYGRRKHPGSRDDYMLQTALWLSEKYPEKIVKSLDKTLKT